ncbi:MAG: ABC transporter substrate-binding protein [Alphaproteobacteria bacterium]|nr:ABC transporter substrate-binding protein [Alphaproteobacteria bacterium]
MNRRSVLLTTGAAAISTFGIGRARAADDLNWSIHCDLTGPAAEGGKYQGDGFAAYAEWINGKGGIRGRKVVATINDSTFKVDVAVANVKKALAQGRVDYIFGESTGMIQAISPENNATNKILMTSGSFASELADQKTYPYHFVPGATYGAQIRMLVDYVKTSSGATPAKLVFIHSSTAMGRDGIDDSVGYAKSLGINVALVQQTKFVETDVSAFALAIRQQQPTHVIHHGYSLAVWPEIIRLVRDYGMDKVVFLGTIWQSEHAKVRDMKDVADGLIGIRVWNDDTTKPAGEMIKLMGELTRKKDPKFNGILRLGFIDAWISAMMVTKATEMVIDAGQAVNGDTLSAAMRSIKNWDTGGIVGAPVSITNQQIGLGQVVKYSKAANFEPQPVTPWVKAG